MIALSFLAPFAAAAPGPFLVGQRDVAFVDGQRGGVRGRVYYPATAAGRDTPADPSAGPFPLVGNMHGWLGQAWMYDGICQELASWGYVVASTDTETGLFLDMEVFARDTDALLHWVDDASATPGDPLEGMVAGGDWAALGHSMGGATLAELVDLEPRIRTIVAFMPYQGDPAYYDQLADYDGAALYLSGSDDGTAPPPMQRAWFASMERTSRGLLLELRGFGHQAVTDLPDEEGSVPKDDQFDAVAALASTFVRAELGRDEDLYAELFATAAAWPGSRSSASHRPAVWATLDGAEVEIGVLGVGADATERWLGTGPGATGDVALAGAVLAEGSALVDGISVVRTPVPWEGGLALQARTGGLLTRAITLIEAPEPPVDTGLPEDTAAPADTGLPADTGAPADTDPPDPTTPDPTGDTAAPAADPEPPSTTGPSRGCDHLGTGGAFAGLLALALAPRRRR